MSETLEKIWRLVSNNAYKVSEHALAELEQDDISLAEIVDGLGGSLIVEDYPTAWKGASVLVLATLKSGDRAHALWGIPNSGGDMAVLITAYRPEAAKWFPDLLRRRLK